MKRFKTTALGVVLLVALAAYVYFFEIHRPGAPEGWGSLFPDVEAGDVSALVINYPGYSLEFERGVWGWTMSATPGEEGARRFPARAELIDSLVDTLLGMGAKKLATEFLQNPAEYGSDIPRAVVALIAGGRVHTLNIGAESPTGSGVYAKIGGRSEVFIIGESTVYPFLDRGPEEFRDTRLSPFPPGSVSWLGIKAPGREIDLIRAGDTWVASEGPIKATFDHDAVGRLAGRLEGEQISAFVTDEPGELAEYGLARPLGAVVLGVGTGEGRQRATVFLGGETGDGGMYVLVEPTGAVYEVSGGLMVDFRAAVDSITDRIVFPFAQDELARVLVETSHGSGTFVRTGQGWIPGKGGEGASVEAGRLVAYLLGAWIVDYVEDRAGDLSVYGLASPRARIEVVGPAGSRSVIIGKGARVGGMKVAYAMLEGMDGVFLVPADIARVAEGEVRPLVIPSGVAGGLESLLIRSLRLLSCLP